VVPFCPSLEDVVTQIRMSDALFINPPSTPLVRLKHLDIRHATTDGIQLNILREIATAAPNLTRLTCQKVDQRRSKLLPLPTLPKLEELKLRDASISAGTLSELLIVCPNLRSFTYVAGERQHARRPPEQLTPREAAETLVSFAPNLKELELEMSSVQANVQDEAQMVRSLTRLTRLKRLTLDVRCLLPVCHLLPAHALGTNTVSPLDPMALVKLLPNSIRVMVLRLAWNAWPDIQTRVDSWAMQLLLFGLATEIPANFPRLESVTVQDFALREEESTSLAAAFDRHGVKAFTR